MQEVPIPRYVDSQPQFLFWEIDEVAIVAVCMGVGIIFEILGPLLLASFVLTWQFRKYKMARMEGILHHVCFWFGLTTLNRKFSNGLEREIVE